ncbi:hypothetical protein I7I48_11866 [Histoplasma ohiense]|nr:hypothetical protein I7I48_11866 [Histoplasma ohiense (nom. inval.)]
MAEYYSKEKSIHTSFKSLSINTEPTVKKKPPRKRSSPVAESWEDEPLSSSSSDENEDDITPPVSATLRCPITTNTTSSTSNSTPSSRVEAATHAPPLVSDLPSPACTTPPRHTASPPRPRIPSMERRPEKQTAVASRMIAGALGIRAPKRTEEQRAYDRAMREKEAKQRERQRELEDSSRKEAEKARAAIWEE